MNSSPPAGKLALRLESISTAEGWLIIAAGAALLVAFDLSFPHVGMAPLYVPLVSVATWMHGPRPSFALAVVAMFLSLLTHINIGDLTAAEMVGKALARLASYVFIVGITASFRRSYNRERFAVRRDLATGALNKHTFERNAERMIEAAAAVERVLLLATIDLDDFKSVNDQHGHAAGDAALRAFAANASAVIRRQDSFGRVGGDEFALLVPIETAEEGRATANAVHERLTGVLRELPYPVAFSMGALIVYPGAHCTRAELMNQADRLMYAVKRSGKGAVRIDTIGPELARISNDGQHGRREVSPRRVVPITS